MNLLLYNQLVKHSKIVSQSTGRMGDDVVDPAGILVLSSGL